MSQTDLLEHRTFGQTSRTDAWWARPLVVLVTLAAFIVYSTWATFQVEHYYFGSYLSPFYSPELLGSSVHSWFGSKPGWWPTWMPWSPALLILWLPGGFRLTCYYYRGAYYKSFWGDPPSCTVGEPRKNYRGENSIPLIIQNVHRYFLYAALIFIVILASDVWHALWHINLATGKESFGIGIGTLILAVNVVLLGGYTLGCHSLRHLIGGFRNRLTGRPLQFGAYRCVSCLNRSHMIWAWSSLLWVAFSDIYIRLCSMGIWVDWRII